MSDLTSEVSENDVHKIQYSKAYLKAKDSKSPEVSLAGGGMFTDLQVPVQA
ncbi:hypothetical protein GCM10023178_68990 [Actinomadura luteofluorescens]